MTGGMAFWLVLISIVSFLGSTLITLAAQFGHKTPAMEQQQWYGQVQVAVSKTQATAQNPVVLWVGLFIAMMMTQGIVLITITSQL